MKQLTIIYMFIAIFLISCDSSNAIRNDVQKKIVIHKEFINSLFFKGIVKEKKYCEKCTFNKYQVVFSLQSINIDSVPIGMTSFQPYYFFSNDKELTMSITKIYFENVTVGDTIIKKQWVNEITSNRKNYLLINSNQNTWLPQ